MFLRIKPREGAEICKTAMTVDLIPLKTVAFFKESHFLLHGIDGLWITRKTSESKFQPFQDRYKVK